MDIFDRIGNILDNFESILVGLIFLCFLFYLFSASVEKFGIKGVFIVIIMLAGLIAFGFLVYDLTQGQNLFVQALAEFVVGITFYFILKYFLKGII